jgi:predicted O-methyltransferase YrrM
MSLPLVISFYTPDNEYKDWVKTLIASCKKFGLEHEITEVNLAALKTWHARCAHKGKFMYFAMKRHNRPLLWLDADSEIVAHLDIFDDPDFDFAANAGLSGTLRSGTVYAAPAARKLLRITANLCHSRPGLAHEKNMHAAYKQCRNQLRCHLLDHGYNRVPEQILPKGSWAGRIFILSNHVSRGGYHGAMFPQAPSNRRPKNAKAFKTLLTSFYSDLDGGTFYRRCARKLHIRCDELGIECDLRERKNQGAWLKNCNMKPSHILEVLEQRKRAVLWLDVDARLHFTPWDVDKLDCDVAAVPYKGSMRNDPPLRIRATTLYFNYTPQAMAFLRRWKEMCDANKSDTEADHQMLERTWREFEANETCRFGSMPETYAYLRGDATDKTIKNPIISIGLATEVKDRRAAMTRFAKRTTRLSWENVFGYFNDSQRQFYDRMVEGAKNGAVFIEVGCLLGKSTIYLAQAAQKAGKNVVIHAVDHFKGSDEKAHKTDPRVAGVNMKLEFERNILAAGVAKMIRVDCGNSVDMARTFDPKSADLVFLDASHDYDSVKADILAWRDVVKPGGVLAGDDFDNNWPGVNRAVQELLSDSHPEGKIWVYPIPNEQK